MCLFDDEWIIQSQDGVSFYGSDGDIGEVLRIICSKFTLTYLLSWDIFRSWQNISFIECLDSPSSFVHMFTPRSFQAHLSQSVSFYTLFDFYQSVPQAGCSHVSFLATSRSAGSTSSGQARISQWPFLRGLVINVVQMLTVHTGWNCNDIPSVSDFHP